MVTALADTSALLALLDEGEQNHARAVQILESLGPGDLLTTNYVLVEALALARRRLGAAAALQLTDGLLVGIPLVWIDEPMHREAMAAFRARPGGPSFVDQTSFVVMRQLGIRAAFAFDRDFEAEGFELLNPGLAPRPPRLSETVAPYGEPGDLVSVAEIASRSVHPVSTINSWRRRHASFPRPIALLAAGPVWSWPDIAAWIDKRAASSA